MRTGLGSTVVWHERPSKKRVSQGSVGSHRVGSTTGVRTRTRTDVRPRTFPDKKKQQRKVIGQHEQDNVTRNHTCVSNLTTTFRRRVFFCASPLTLWKSVHALQYADTQQHTHTPPPPPRLSPHGPTSTTITTTPPPGFANTVNMCNTQSIGRRRSQMMPDARWELVMQSRTVHQSHKRTTCVEKWINSHSLLR